MINKKKIKKCCICNQKFTGYGNNPRPVKETGEACDDCNFHIVVPARIKLLLHSK